MLAMDETLRRSLLFEIAETIRRHGWGDMSHENAHDAFESDLEIEQFADKHDCMVRGHLSGGSLIFFRKSLES
jgi:hypothetical protein